MSCQTRCNSDFGRFLHVERGGLLLQGFLSPKKLLPHGRARIPDCFSVPSTQSNEAADSTRNVSNIFSSKLGRMSLSQSLRGKEAILEVPYLVVTLRKMMDVLSFCEREFRLSSINKDFV